MAARPWPTNSAPPTATLTAPPRHRLTLSVPAASPLRSAGTTDMAAADAVAKHPPTPAPHRMSGSHRSPRAVTSSMVANIAAPIASSASAPPTGMA